jgi:hypothetical protein
VTAIERGYVLQGWKVPNGWTTDRIALERAQYEVDEIYVPIASAHGIIAWGVPIIEGKPLRHDVNIAPL